MPSFKSRRAELEALGEGAFAHRGLHGGAVVENSPSAIQAAAAAGYGIEIDVRLSRDGIAMVFHDETVDRLTHETGPLAARTGDELQKLRLRTSPEPMPRLSEALRMVGGRVPLLIEVKTSGASAGPLCAAVREALDGYGGPVAVMSFNPEVGAWFARRAPGTLRGLVMSEEGKKGIKGAIERRVSLWRSRADFLAYDVRDLPSPFAAAARRRGHPVYTWTVRTADQQAAAQANADQMIFELPPA